MKITKKVQIVKNNKSIATLIFSQKQETLDIKICIHSNEYDIKGYTLFNNVPIIKCIKRHENTELEITYHSKNGDLSPKIHIKTTENGESIYDTLPLKRISSPTTDSLVPFPVLKIEIPDNTIDSFKDFNEKHSNRYQLVKINDDHKIVELYLISDESKFLEHYHPYNKSAMYFLLCIFEYFCTNKIDINKIRSEYISTVGPEPKFRLGIHVQFDGFRLAGFASPFDGLESMVKKPTITFIENELSDAIYYHSLYIEDRDSFNIGNIDLSNLKSMNYENLEKNWYSNSLSYILFRGVMSSEERREIKKSALDYLKTLISEAKGFL